MPRALIIGAAGQDGRLLTEFLKARGYDVRGWTRPAGNSALPANARPVNLLEGDVVARELTREEPDEIYYLAAFHHATEDEIRISEEDLLQRSRDVHVVGWRHVLRAVEAAGGEARLFYASSSHVFGVNDGEFQNEETPFAPNSPYGISKAEGIECARLFRRRGLFVASGILFNHESSFRKPSFLSQKIVRAALTASANPKHRLVLGDLMARVDWGDARDYVEAMWRILQLPAADDFIIASGETHTVGEFVSVAFREAGLNAEEFVEVDPQLLRKPPQTLCGDARKLHQATGWSPTRGFEEMVQSLVREGRAARNNLLIFVPTYNESENVERLCRELIALPFPADILFCDDHSPDGTGTIIDRLADEFPQVRALHRPGKLGIGSAHQDGIRYAYEQQYQTLVTMDCDFTHKPTDVARLLDLAGGSGQIVTIGSRYLERDSLPGWNLLRRSLTHLGHLLTTRLLKLPQDATGALRCYQLSRIPQDLFARVRSRGYSFFFESLFVFHRNGFTIAEMPIALPARTYGSSKMSLQETWRSAYRLLKLYWAGLRHPESFLLSSPIPPILAAESALEDPQGWDSYWTQSQDRVRSSYSFVASTYRRLAIRRNLNRCIHKHFPPGARLLHAGCGSGQVDADLSREMHITAVDISMPALESYRRNNPKAEMVQHGDILNLYQLGSGTFDGAYNLGVVEHFTEDQIVQILREMSRTVKPGGKVVIFWPHRRATSVLVLKAIHVVLGWFRRADGTPVRLHPAEISLLESRDQARDVVERAGLNLVDYYFGIRDLLVQAVVIGAKK